MSNIRDLWKKIVIIWSYGYENEFYNVDLKFALQTIYQPHRVFVVPFEN